MKNNDCGIELSETRFAIADDNGKIIDTANGYGYKTFQNAHKAMWYKFNGGKQKIKQKDDDKKNFFKTHIGLEKFLHKFIENNIKEIARGELSNKEILDWIKEEFQVDMPEEYIFD
ncbi:MAG: hypothetical protein WC375_11100 [Methanomassiliicoccales archaeon]